MKIMKEFLRNIYYFGVGVSATCHEMKQYITTRSRRSWMTGAISLALVSAMITTSACGARKVSDDPAPSGESSSVSESQSDESKKEDDKKSSSEEETGPVTLSADAELFNPIDVDKLRASLEELRVAYQKEATSKVPTAGNLEEWKKINSDVVGWLNIPDTNINYPLLYTQNTDYYTHRGYYKEQSKNGVIWFDEDTKFTEKGDITSTNGIIYGHNWTNCWDPIRVANPQDIMFAQLAAYHYEDFAKSHPYVYVTTPAGQKKYQVFTAFYTDLSIPYFYAELPNDKYGIKMTMDEMINKCIEKGQYKTGITATSKDKIITLSTCTRVLGATDQQRFVVMAKLVP